MDAKKKFLIDTDIGDTIDDTFALLVAMANALDIVGVTTVFRDTVARAGMVKKLMRAFGKGYGQVPVYSGYSIYSDHGDTNCEHMCRFDRELYLPELAPENTDPEAAADYIVDCCRRYGKDLTILAIGPFCNLAKAIEKDRDAVNSAGGVVIMGGAYFKQYADWNVMCDVAAADVMFQNLTNLICIGADVTHRLICDSFLTDILYSGRSGSKAFAYLQELYRGWKADYPLNALVLHDVLTVYYALDPAICALRQIPVVVITEGYAKGLTLNVDAYSKAGLNDAYHTPRPGTRVLAAEDVDLEKFQALVRRDILACID